MCPTRSGQGDFQPKSGLFWHKNESIKRRIHSGMTILHTDVRSLSSASFFGKNAAPLPQDWKLCPKHLSHGLIGSNRPALGTVAFVGCKSGSILSRDFVEGIATDKS
jgi:hypothetical protein